MKMKRKLLNIIATTALVALFVAATACGQDETDTSEDVAIDQESEAVAVSTLPIAPDFDLPAANKGTDISLSQFRDDKPVVLVFYRAYW